MDERGGMSEWRFWGIQLRGDKDLNSGNDREGRKEGTGLRSHPDLKQEDLMVDQI